MHINKQKSKYPTYKSTNIDWIGEIPVDWKVVKVKTIFNKIKVKAKEDNPTILSLTSKGIVIRNISNNDGQIAESYYDYNPVNVGDLLLNPMDLVTNAFSSISKVKGVISPAYFNLRNKENICSNYYDYYFKLQYWNLTFFAHGKGVSTDHRWTLNNETLMNYFVPNPSFQEQKSIADYLDTKTSQIDQIIALKQQQIELFKERRTALINHVVTKGLDPNVEMVDSGIEWIGMIPKGWEVKRLKRVILMINRGMSPNYADDETNIKILNQACIYWGSINLEKIKYNIELEDMSKRGKIFKGDILMNSTGTGTLGRAVVFDIDDSNYYADSHVTIIRANKNSNSKYLTYLLSTDMYQNYIYATCVSGSTNQIELSRENMRIVEFISPSLKEQQAIADYLNSKTSQIDQTITAVEKSIELLTEYKQSLISHVVTGKVKVF